MKGVFISFEGIEGSGKSTQVGLLGSNLKEKGFNPVIVREPGGTRIGELIRNITHDRENVELTAVAEAYLMAASRAQLVREIIRPALNDGKIVISDRFIDSSLSYQGYARELGEEKIEELNILAVDGVSPDLTFFLDISPDLGFARRNGSGILDRLDLQQKDFYERVYRGYKDLAAKYPKRYCAIDSRQTVGDVAKIISDKTDLLLKNRR